MINPNVFLGFTFKIDGNLHIGNFIVKMESSIATTDAFYELRQLAKEAAMLDHPGKIVTAVIITTWRRLEISE